MAAKQTTSLGSRLKRNGRQYERDHHVLYYSKIMCLGNRGSGASQPSTSGRGRIFSEEKFVTRVSDVGREFDIAYTKIELLNRKLEIAPPTKHNKKFAPFRQRSAVPVRFLNLGMKSSSKLVTGEDFYKPISKATSLTVRRPV